MGNSRQAGAVNGRQPERDDRLIHHSDRGSQSVPIRFSERPAEAGIAPPAGRKSDSYDNILAETINGQYKAQLIHRRAPARRGKRWSRQRSGMLVQPSPGAGINRLYPDCRSCGKLLPAMELSGYDGVTQANRPPQNSGSLH
jgi:hypothetical protein